MDTPPKWDSEPVLQKITDIAPGIIYIFNQKTQSNEYSNRLLGELLGYTAAEIQEMGAEMMPRLCHPDDLGRIVAYFGDLQALVDGHSTQLEYRMRHKNGRWVWLLSNDTIFERDADGSVLRHIGIATDITAQKTAEERAIAEKLRATTTNDELRAFSYSMSHDMKAPSNTLNLLLTELLDTHRGTLDPDAVELLDMSLDTVNRMRDLVDNVLKYTHLVEKQLSIEPVDLSALISNICKDLHALIQLSGAQIEVRDLPVVNADPLQLRILFQNLIENAIKFHRKNEPPKIQVFSRTQEERNVYRIAVRDHGIGIDPSKHQKIFTIFKRLHANMEYSGSGLGLAICRRIVTNHGGKIEVASELDKGATFTVELSTS